jgi:hypothetical protein
MVDSIVAVERQLWWVVPMRSALVTSQSCGGHDHDLEIIWCFGEVYREYIMKRLLMAATVILAMTASAEATTYNFDVTMGTALLGINTVTGTITTDGTIGALSLSDLVTWNLTIQTIGGPVPGGPETLIGPGQAGSNSIAATLFSSPSSFTDLVATATTLSYFFGDTSQPSLLEIVEGGLGGDGIDLWNAGAVPPTGLFELTIDGQGFGISPTPQTTPLPAALPLFATGLGAMGLFGWRRKRKNTTAIAAA